MPVSPLADTAVCDKTGLGLVRASRQTVWRVAKSTYGAMNPLLRSAGTVERKDWGRWDVPGHRTIYAATAKAAAYAESLAWARPTTGKFGYDPKLTELFDVDPHDVRTMNEVIETEWNSRNHLGPEKLAAGWRLDRLLYRLTLPATGWLVDIERADSVAVLNKALAGQLTAMGEPPLTVGALLGENRALTTLVADWVWHQTLADGSLPHGLAYNSKHGTDWACCAVWLRRVDDGKSLASEPTKANDGQEIKSTDHDGDLAKVCDMFGIHKVF